MVSGSDSLIATVKFWKDSSGKTVYVEVDCPDIPIEIPETTITTYVEVPREKTSWDHFKDWWFGITFSLMLLGGAWKIFSPKLPKFKKFW